jgi:hypothetical protein
MGTLSEPLDRWFFKICTTCTYPLPRLSGFSCWFFSDLWRYTNRAESRAYRHRALSLRPRPSYSPPLLPHASRACSPSSAPRRRCLSPPRSLHRCATFPARLPAIHTPCPPMLNMRCPSSFSFSSKGRPPPLLHASCAVLPSTSVLHLYSPPLIRNFRGSFSCNTRCWLHTLPTCLQDAIPTLPTASSRLPHLLSSRCSSPSLFLPDTLRRYTPRLNIPSTRPQCAEYLVRPLLVLSGSRSVLLSAALHHRRSLSTTTSPMHDFRASSSLRSNISSTRPLGC